MAFVTVSDVAAEIPGKTFTDAVTGPPAIAASQPSASQVQGYLDAVTAEVTALVTGLGIPWPADATATSTFLRTTIITGAVAKTLSSMFQLSAPERTPASVGVKYREYQDALKRLPDVVRGVTAVAPTVEGRTRPLVRTPHSAPRPYEDLTSFTHRREREDRPWYPRRWIG